MDNIIFNGTKNRKPTQLAEVSITFNNTKNLLPTEYSKVTITRRYYRSGESEYQLNGITCRLKDITNLFLDTGITSNSYAIIELKMIDDLLNDKDNSRRNLFEEAAGISKFKMRKKESLRKLSDTDADLARVDDLLYEIEKNLKTLERQAKQAKNYYEIKEDYKLLSISLARKSTFAQQEVHDSTQKRIQSETDKKQALNTQITTHEAISGQLKTTLLQKEKTLAGQQKTLNDHVHKIRSYENEKKIKSERQRFLQDKIDQLKNQINQDKESNERSSFAIQGLQKNLLEATDALNKITSKLEALKLQYERQKNTTIAGQGLLDELNQQYLNQRESVFQYSKDLEIKQIQLNTLKIEHEKTNSDSSEHTSSLNELESKINEIELEKADKQQGYESLSKEQELIDQNISSYSKKIELLKDEFNLVNRSLDAKENEYNLIKSMVDNLEGFPEAIKFLRKKSQWKNAPLLSDVLSCPKEYRICIENFLEPYMNYYVVENISDALNAVSLLNDSNKGKANFFVLDQLESFKPLDTLLIDNVRSATELIDYEYKYKKLITFLLHNVYVYDGAVPQPRPNVVFIEKSGKIIHRAFSISGGSVGLFEGKRIGRVKNLENLAIEIKKLKNQQQVVQQKLLENQHKYEQLKIKNKSIELEALREEINKINESLTTFKTKQEQFYNLLNSNSTRREDIQNQIYLINDDIERIKPLLEDRKNSLNDLESLVFDQKGTVERLNISLTQDASVYNEGNVKYHQDKNKVDSIVQEISYKEESYQGSLNRIIYNNEALKESENNLKNLINLTMNDDDQLIEMYAEKERFELALNEIEKEYYGGRESIDQQDKLIRELLRQRETGDQLIMEWQNKLNDAKIILNSIKDRLSVEFNLDFDSIDEQSLNPEYERLTLDIIQSQASERKKKLENMGPINPMAMEAYDEIKERYDFISSQKEDLVKAKEILLSTIEEINSVAKETFMTSFELIKANFIKVFRTLFTDEDDCDLSLTNPDEPLESSIEIIAKPKGKRPLTINQLSGGEKTLTATALLFAIYLIKPAPFCIFDEVDAPLDDANIDKFNQIIREFSNQSQFIIVTHNKRTMSSTDLIYGITMIEQGISKVVPVDLRELE
tara:strand:+ start:7493 stop:10837 length:3345 start_codon:yes stop_codon:yes gene_type:complete